MLKAFFPAIIWSIVILALSAGPGIQLPSGFWDEISWDKAGHFGAYVVLVFLLLWGFYRIGWHHPLPAILLAILFGLTMEVLQLTFFPYRHFEWADMLANILGALTGYGVFRRLIYHLNF